eukprot:4673160-Amphidinium_carterae.1
MSVSLLTFPSFRCTFTQTHAVAIGADFSGFQRLHIMCASTFSDALSVHRSGLQGGDEAVIYTAKEAHTSC